MGSPYLETGTAVQETAVSCAAEAVAASPVQ